ncbi:hypothetical protein [Streptomyces radicis]|uniref:Nucleotidyltransferase-like protein n=1 Tax=Streptomyces radicis TaxID=1750517 RepID=A0A3A9W3V5_9ACTN|nr:hypothetical protein [Streptomyces radicis]RKN07539.1 hypothetical protein D7319_17850 [Streptomyces radicis]RKN13670.1 hypothetical protein D7318_30570 [Streptomyces radicis]
MAKAPEGVDRDELTVVARKVLLDGLEALKEHLSALTIVGAQAVHLRTPDAVMSTAPYTTDGDLSIDPLLLGEHPHLDAALRAAGFQLINKSQPGLWQRPEALGDRTIPVELDLLVPRQLSPKNGSRSAKVPPHGVMSARWIEGLETAAVDRSPLTVGSLDPRDGRSITVNVAGPAALLVAKAFKISERVEQAATRPDRLVIKDAGDVLRIMMATPVRQVAAAFVGLRADPRVGDVTSQGLEKLHALFGGAATRGVEMAVGALAGDISEARVRALAPAFMRRLPR